MRMVFLASMALIAACSDGKSLADGGVAAEALETGMTSTPAASAPGRDLPFANGQRFATLDDYLAFLKKAGEYDTPWYREVKPGVGVYERVTRLPPGQRPEVVTRAELLKRYGFAN